MFFLLFVMLSNFSMNKVDYKYEAGLNKCNCTHIFVVLIC